MIRPSRGRRLITGAPTRSSVARSDTPLAHPLARLPVRHQGQAARRTRIDRRDATRIEAVRVRARPPPTHRAVGVRVVDREADRSRPDRRSHGRFRASSFSAPTVSVVVVTPTRRGARGVETRAERDGRRSEARARAVVRQARPRARPPAPSRRSRRRPLRRRSRRLRASPLAPPASRALPRRIRVRVRRHRHPARQLRVRAMLLAPGPAALLPRERGDGARGRSRSPHGGRGQVRRPRRRARVQPSRPRRET